MTGLVQFERQGGVAWLTLNRPDKRNALNLALWSELEVHLAAIEALGDELGAVVLRGCCPALFSLIHGHCQCCELVMPSALCLGRGRLARARRRARDAALYALARRLFTRAALRVRRSALSEA